MVVPDEGFGTDLTPVEVGGDHSSRAAVAVHAPCDWRSWYEQAHARAERERARASAAEVRSEELRRAELGSRIDAGLWKSRFKACRDRLSVAEEKTKEARGSARDVPSLQATVAHRRVDGRPRPAGLARDAGRQPKALHTAVRAAGRGDPRAPEQGGAAPCRRDRLERAGASRRRPVKPRLAVDLGQRRRGLLSR